MGGMRNSQIRHLTLDNLTVNPSVARRLPLAIACRYHALPVAEADGRVTIAMADPDDAMAREAVAGALGTPSLVVGCDPMTINALLAEAWPEMLQRSLRLLVWTQARPTAEAHEPPETLARARREDAPAAVTALKYAQALSGLLNAELCHVSSSRGNGGGREPGTRLMRPDGYDLVIWEEPGQSTRRRLASGPAYRRAVEQISCSLLIARSPRWPLRRLLLVVRGDPLDDMAVIWIVRLARSSGAAVTALTVVPPVPAMYDRFPRMQQGLDALLTTDTTLGRQMRRVAQWLVEWELEGTLRLRQGAPDEQIRREVIEGDYDLIAVGASPHAPVRRWLLGDWSASLLCWADRPVLIAKPTTA